MAELEGRTALIVGGGSVGAGVGNGQAIARLFAARGANVVIVDRDEQAANRTTEAIRAEGHRCLFVKADVLHAHDIETSVAAALEAYAAIDILVNNAGITCPGGPVETSEEDWDRVFGVNVKSAFLYCKFVLPHMLRAGRGNIINISSTSSICYGGVSYIAYASSKAALNHFTRYVGLEYATRGIRCNAILPGLIDTPMVEAYGASGYSKAGDIGEMKRRRAKLSPTGKQGTAWDVANAALYLASDASAYVNATLHVVDGGYSVVSPGPQHIS